MSKVAERMDAKRTRYSWGRFLLRDRGTQRGGRVVGLSPFVSSARKVVSKEHRARGSGDGFSSVARDGRCDFTNAPPRYPCLAGFTNSLNRLLFDNWLLEVSLFRLSQPLLNAVSRGNSVVK